MSCPSCRGDGYHRSGCPDAPGCRWCGRDVDASGALCEECQEERQEARAEEAFEARREVLLSERRWAADDLVEAEA